MADVVPPEPFLFSDQESQPSVAQPCPPPFRIAGSGEDSDQQDSELSRRARWDAVAQAIISQLPTMERFVPAAPKGKRVLDPADPAAKEAPARFPLHPSIKEVLQVIPEDIKTAKSLDPKEKQPRVTPSRVIPESYFRPGDMPSFWQPVELESSIRRLHVGQFPTSPGSFQMSETDLKEREESLRAILSVESAKKWLEEAALQTLDVMDLQPGMAEFAQSLRDLLVTQRSLAILQLDRFTTELVNIILQRRDLWLRALYPVPRDQLFLSLRTAKVDSEWLFGGVSTETVDGIVAQRREDGIMKLVTLKEKPAPPPQKKPVAPPAFQRRGPPQVPQQGQRGRPNAPGPRQGRPAPSQPGQRSQGQRHFARGPRRGGPPKQKAAGNPGGQPKPKPQ